MEKMSHHLLNRITIYKKGYDLLIEERDKFNNPLFTHTVRNFSFQLGDTLTLILPKDENESSIT